MGAQARYLGVPGEQELLGRGVSACATCDGFFFRDHDIVVVGGGDSAMEEATFLTRFARSVTILHRRSEFRASGIMLERARQDPKITIRTDTVVEEVLGDTTVEGVRVRNTATGEEETLAVSGLFVAVGHDPRSGLVRDVVDTDDEGYVRVALPGTGTNIPGVFACGDLVDHTYRQAITAAGSGCQASIDAERWLAETRRRRPRHRPAAHPGRGRCAGRRPGLDRGLRGPREQRWFGRRGIARARGRRRSRPLLIPFDPLHRKETTRMSAPVNVTDATFADQVLGSDKPVVVDFWATWCGPCKMVAPVLEEIAAEHGDKLTVAKLDIDQNPATARDYQVMSIPTLLVFQDGKPVKQIVGAKPKSVLLDDLSDVLA